MINILRYFCGLFLIIILINATEVKAQATVDRGFPSGDYDEVKVSCDTASKTFTIIDESEQGSFSCSLFLSGSLVKDRDGKYPVKAYPYGFNNNAFAGTVLFREGKNGTKSTLIIKINQTGACQSLTDYKSGAYLPLDKVIAYHKFGMIKVPKAIAYADSLANASKKGYLIERDCVSVLKETKNFCYITYLKKPTFRAWVKKTDLLL